MEALPCPVIVMDAAQAITYANGAAEYFFATSQSVLKRLRLVDVVPFSSPLIGLLAQVRQDNVRINEYAVHVGTPRTGGERIVD
ncbi:MAG: PAS domain-containing protein, partial [Aestuariivirgaceae bacterium]